ncbi:MAG: F0F1 ATP synthase subunit epsilon [Longimicrobiales bacterium]|nr:F0F1 ATP synthase subunit epsilon [Longimicrobiales bacterium]
MRLEVLIPSRVVVRDQVSAVVAEGAEGSFGVLPHHVDYVSPLVPGILTYRRAEDDGERILALDQGTLVKVGQEVLISVRDAVEGEDLGTLRQTVEERFRSLDQKEREARSALATLEARFIRRFLEQIGRVPE